MKAATGSNDTKKTNTFANTLEVGFTYKTLGCKVNQAESDEIASELIERGLKLCAPGTVGSRSVTFVNTCAVTSLSEQKCRQTIRAIRREDPTGLLIVTGCYAKNLEAEKTLSETVDLFLSNKDKNTLADQVMSRLGEIAKSAPMEVSKFRTRALLKAQDGCDQFCHYCAVPLYRKDLSWRRLEDLEERCLALIASGTREIVLTGTNLSLYGLGKAEDFDGLSRSQTAERTSPKISDVLNHLGSLPGDFRIRLSSLEINEQSLDLPSRLAEGLKLARHFHIPLQSGSDPVLRAMGRKYLTADILSFINDLRKKFPGATITTDVIVGFPGETEGDLTATIDTLKKMNPVKVHVFKYSERPGTEATLSSSRVPERIRKERSIKVRVAAEALRAAILKDMVGMTFKVLVEKRLGPAPRGQVGDFEGYSSQYVKVVIQGKDTQIGEIVLVKIIGIAGDGLLGDLQS